jgi:hypothetical protein
MEEEFSRKKRPREMMLSPPETPRRLETNRDRTSSLSLQLQSLNLPNQSVPLQSQIVGIGEHTDSAKAMASPATAENTLRIPTQNQQIIFPSTPAQIQQQDSVRHDETTSDETTSEWNKNRLWEAQASSQVMAEAGDAQWKDATISSVVN